MKPVLSTVAFALVVLTPSFAFACPGCFSGNDANRIAYFTTFVILTVLPLAMVGGLLYYLRKRARELGSAESR